MKESSSILSDFQSVSFDCFNRLEAIVAEGPCGVLTYARMKHDSEMTDNRLIFKVSVMLLVPSSMSPLAASSRVMGSSGRSEGYTGLENVQFHFGRWTFLWLLIKRSHLAG